MHGHDTNEDFANGPRITRNRQFQTALPANSPLSDVRRLPVIGLPGWLFTARVGAQFGECGFSRVPELDSRGSAYEYPGERITSSPADAAQNAHSGTTEAHGGRESRPSVGEIKIR